jgi:HSP20 family molecular chaperone IbpA
MSIFDDFERTIEPFSTAVLRTPACPRVDVREEASRFVLEAEIPAFPRRMSRSRWKRTFSPSPR